MQNAIIILSILLVIVFIAAIVFRAQRGRARTLHRAALLRNISAGVDLNTARVNELEALRQRTAAIDVAKMSERAFADITRRNTEISDQLQRSTAENDKLTVRVTALETIREALEASENQTAKEKRELAAELEKLKAPKPLPTFKRHAKAKRK